MKFTEVCLNYFQLFYILSEEISYALSTPWRWRIAVGWTAVSNGIFYITSGLCSVQLYHLLPYEDLDPVNVFSNLPPHDSHPLYDRLSPILCNGLIELCLKLAGKQFQEMVYGLLFMGTVGVFIARDIIIIIKKLFVDCQRLCLKLRDT